MPRAHKTASDRGFGDYCAIAKTLNGAISRRRDVALAGGGMTRRFRLSEDDLFDNNWISRTSLILSGEMFGFHLYAGGRGRKALGIVGNRRDECVG